MKRTRSKKREAKKKQTKADFYRSWGMNPYTYIRYSGIRGVYWHYFSRSIRARDYKEHGGLCMTCLRYVERGDDQCGHFFPAANCHFDLLFHPMNNHLQHAKCNNPRFSPHAGIHNTVNLLTRYGPDLVDMLQAIKSRPNQKEWTKAEYRERLKALGVTQG